MALLVLALGTADSHAADATVYVVHGIPGVAVDVAVDGDCAVEGFEFADQVGPIALSPGIHTITVSLANPMEPCTGMVVLEAPVPFMDGESATIAAYLDEMGNPTAAKFSNDFSRPDPGMVRIIAHHCAAAPPVDIGVSRDRDAPFDPMVVGLANGDQVIEHFRPGEWYVSIAPTGTTDPVYGPTLVRVKPFTVYRLFAIVHPVSEEVYLLNFEYDAK
jgi:hypothetical protein